MSIDFSDNIDSLFADLSREAKFAKEAAELKELHDRERKKELPVRPAAVTLTKKVQLPVVEVTNASPEALVQSLYHTLANESRRITAEISGVLGDLDVEVEDDVIVEELSVELKKVPVLIDDDEEEVEVQDITPEEVQNLVSRSAELLSTLEDVNYKPDADNAYLTDVGQLAKRIEVMQNTLAKMTSVGWGQAGMTYGSGEVRLEFLDDVNRDSAKTDGYYLKYQASTGKWIGSSSTETEFDPSGYEYTNDSSLKLIENETDNNGLVVDEGTWTKLPCSGYTTNNLPTGDHSGIAGTAAFTGSGSTTYSRIWNSTVARFFFDELDQKTVLIFRLKIDMIPETNNTLVSARINFRAMADGTDDPLLETSTTEPLQVDRILLEDSSGYIAGDVFQSYSFQQTVAGQELADGAGTEHERTYVFPIYVGDSAAQRGFGEFEVYTTAEMVVNDTSILGFLN